MAPMKIVSGISTRSSYLDGCEYHVSMATSWSFPETLPHLMSLGQLHRQAQSPLQSQRAEGHRGVGLDDRASSHGRLAHAWLRASDPAFIRRDALQRCKLNTYKMPRRNQALYGRI